MKRARLCPRALLRTLTVVATATLCGAPAWATPTEDAERARLAQERAAIDAQYKARQSECGERFVVTSCVEDAKRERRRALDALRSRQIELDESRRKERSAARRAELSINAAEQARREAVLASRPAAAASDPIARHDAASRSIEPRQSVVERTSTSKRQVGSDGRANAAPGAGATDRIAKEERSRATFEAHKQQAAEHREDVLDKAMKRMQQHPPAPSLPIPAP